MTPEGNQPPTVPGGPPKSSKMGCLRALVWACPIGIVLVAGLAGGRFGSLRIGSGWMLLGVVLVLVGGLGVFDGVLSPRVPKIDGNPDPKRLALHATLFLIVQAVAVPLVLLGLLYAACALG